MHLDRISVDERFGRPKSQYAANRGIGKIAAETCESILNHVARGSARRLFYQISFDLNLTTEKSAEEKWDLARQFYAGRSRGSRERAMLTDRLISYFNSNNLADIFL